MEVIDVDCTRGRGVGFLLQLYSCTAVKLYS